MPYITLRQSPMYHQITFEEVLSGFCAVPTEISKNESNTRTYFVKNVNPKFLERFDIEEMADTLESFCQVNAALYEKKRESLYDRFYIPKKSGGLREINAPVPELMAALRNLKVIFETKMFALYHTSAFAYIEKRSTIDAIQRHQRNRSNWFLKTDFSNFFGSTTPDFLFRMLSMIFPFSEVVKTDRGKTALTRALDLCFLHGGLPQGTPISPMLTNLMMIPIDHRLYNCLRSYKGHSYVYTRYADDILISSRHHFEQDELVSFVNESCASFRAPFQIKDEKTRYGSRAGSNWNLGLMLNRDNEITIGHKNKARFRAMICSYILDRKSGRAWNLHDVQVLNGLKNYYNMVEHDYIVSVIKFNNKKYNTDVERCLKEDLVQQSKTSPNGKQQSMNRESPAFRHGEC